MSYVVHFRGVGYSEPTAANPKGIKIIASGDLVVEGDRPKDIWGVPWEIGERCKEVFMKQTGAVRYEGDERGVERFPTMRLGREINTEAPHGTVTSLNVLDSEYQDAPAD